MFLIRSGFWSGSLRLVIRSDVSTTEKTAPCDPSTNISSSLVLLPFAPSWFLRRSFLPFLCCSSGLSAMASGLSFVIYQLPPVLVCCIISSLTYILSGCQLCIRLMLCDAWSSVTKRFLQGQWAMVDGVSLAYTPTSCTRKHIHTHARTRRHRNQSSGSGVLT